MNQTLRRTVVVQETHGNWAGMLRRQLAGGNVHVIRVETLAELDLQLADTQMGCFAMEIHGPSAIETLCRLRELKAQRPAACFCGIASRPASRTDLDVPDWAIYEAGASLVIRHPLEISNFARLLRRYFAVRFCGEAIGGTEFTPESVWLSLPWADHAT